MATGYTADDLINALHQAATSAVLTHDFREKCQRAADYIEAASKQVPTAEPAAGIPDDMNTRVRALEARVALLDQAIGRQSADNRRRIG